MNNLLRKWLNLGHLLRRSSKGDDVDDDVPSLAVPATKMEPSVLYTLAVVHQGSLSPLHEQKQVPWFRNRLGPSYYL